MDNNEFFQRCSACGKIIDDEELVTIFEHRGVGRGSEEIVTGYKCECGHEEDY